jgi:hypothetical protein
MNLEIRFSNFKTIMDTLNVEMILADARIFAETELAKRNADRVELYDDSGKLLFQSPRLFKAG